MKLVIKVCWNSVSHEGKHKILWSNDKNAILYNEYTVAIVYD